MKQLPAEGAQLLVVQLDHMKVIEHVHGMPNVLANGPDVGGRHVRGDGLDLGVGTTQPFQKNFRESTPLPSPTYTTAPVSRSSTMVRYRCPLPMLISSM